MVAVFALALLAVGGAPARAQTIPIWPGIAPGSESWTQREQVIPNTPLGTVILDVVTPTLAIYLPSPATSTGTGVIVAPGDACVALAMDVEGTNVARWLQAHGIAAFVLKYRTIEKKQEGIPKDLDMDAACKYGIADGIQAVKVVRERATQWGVSSDRIGFLGFSAGGMVASGALLQPDAAARPNFAAFVYGAPFGVMPSVPANLPPAFMAWAQDDPLARDAMVRFYGALQSAGDRPEAHIFSSGGHGFGLKTQGTTSDRWIDEFYFWLQAHGFARRATVPARAQLTTSAAARGTLKV